MPPIVQVKIRNRQCEATISGASGGDVPGGRERGGAEFVFAIGRHGFESSLRRGAFIGSRFLLWKVLFEIHRVVEVAQDFHVGSGRSK